MYEYEPVIKGENFNDALEEADKPKETVLEVSRSSTERPAINQTNLQFCSVEKLWLDTPGKKGPEDKAVIIPHDDIPAEAPNRWHFAPKEETTKIGWELKGRLASTPTALANPIELKLELFTRKVPQPLWTKIIKWEAGECLLRGETEFNGLLGEDLFKSAVGRTKPTADVVIKSPKNDKFPDGVLTVDHSPYKLKLSIVDGGELRLLVAKWIYIDVLVDSLEMNWGEIAMLPKVRADIADPKNLKKIVGHTKDLNIVNDKDIKGYEEIILEELKLAKPKPTKDFVHEVKLTSNLFAFQKKQETNKESFEFHTDFLSHKALWGNGARIPLVVKAYIKMSTTDGKSDKIPEALGKSKILWDWNEKKVDRWKEAFSNGKAPKTEPFLDEGYQQNNDAKPVALSNCPKEFGGKRGEVSKEANIFPDQVLGGVFPFEVNDCAVRKWASLSSFGKDAKRGESGVIFQPSRMAGDAYMIKAYLHFERDTDSEADITAPPPIQTADFLFKVFRRIQLNSLVRGRAKLKTDPTVLETDLKTDYLKELDMVVEVKQTDVDNVAYKAALKTAINRVCNKEHFVDEVATIANLSLLAKYTIEPDPPADSAGIVFRDWDDINSDLEDKFETSAIRVVNTLSNGGAFLDEDVTGRTSGITGTLFKVDPRRFVLYPMGAGFTNNELVDGLSSQTAGNINVTQGAKSCWGHNFQPVPKTVNDNKIYKDSIRLLFQTNNEVLDIKYKKLPGATTKLSPNLSDSAKLTIIAAFGRAWTAHIEANSFEVQIHARDDSPNALLRSQNLKTYLESFFTQDTIVDRQAVWVEVMKKIKTAFIGTNGTKIQKMLALLLIGEITWEYAAQKLSDEEGIFNLHVPGRYKGYTFPDAVSLVKTDAKMPKVQGAVYPELTGEGNGKPFVSRNRAIAFLASVQDAASDGLNVKSLRSIFKHELAHALFIPHSPFRTNAGRITPEPKGQCHVKEDKCLMNYDLDTEHFCGLCMMRLRGWNWKAQVLENRITKVHILDGDNDTYLAANGVQYVNLPVADKWVDGVDIINKDRLGRKLKVKVEFQQELAGETVSVQLLAHQNNAAYSVAEANRKPSFTFVRSPAAKALGSFDKDHGAVATGVTDDNGNFFAEFDLSPAVGDQYQVIAWDKDDNRVQSVEIRTWRALYYMVLRYAHPQSVPTVQITNQIDATFLPNFTKWIFAGEVIDPANRSFTSADPTHATTTTLIRAATQVNCATPSLAAKQYQDLEPYLSRIVLISMCITPAAITTTPVVAPVGTLSPLARIPIRSQPDVNQGGINFDLRKGLYHNQGPNESLVGGKPLNPAPPLNEYFVKGKATLLRQTAIATVAGRITTAGNARVTVTAAGMNNSPKILNVPVANGTGTNIVAGNIRNALSLDGDVTALFDVSGEFERIILTKKATGAHDATLNIAITNGTCAGLTPAPNAVNTQAGNATPLGYIGIDIPIQFAAITPIVADPVNRPGGFIEADVQVDNLSLNGLVVPQQNAAITLDVYVLNRFVNGMARLSAPNANGILIIPAARDFKINPDNGQLNSILHELGHCMGMNANPTEVQIDGHQYHYNYNGDHCSSGLARTIANDGPSYQTQANQDAAGLCVMFGFTSNVNPRLTFCVDCEGVMKKIDSVAGLF